MVAPVALPTTSILTPTFTSPFPAPSTPYALTAADYATLNLDPTKPLPRWVEAALAEAWADANQLAQSGIFIPTTDEELGHLAYTLTGVRIPNVACCKDHCAPLTAVADAFFARYPLIIWEASRGFGGKSILLAVLAYLEAVVLGASVNLLGGSGRQSANVHEYMAGSNDSNLPGTFWAKSNAPLHLLRTAPTQARTILTNGGRINVLMASQKSVRGPHPNRLLLDEVDEMDIGILNAALGQPMASRGIPSQIVASSTHQNPDGTMTELKKRARLTGIPIYRWCYHESCANGTGWLTEAMIAEKRKVIVKGMWEAEYDLHEPNPTARAIVPEKVDAMFSSTLGHFAGELDEYIEIEAPVAGAKYATGADWAKEVDYSIIITWRVDVRPFKLVAFQRTGRLPWPVMTAKLDERIDRFHEFAVKNRPAGQRIAGFDTKSVIASQAAHDSTGLGNVVRDLLKWKIQDVNLSGPIRNSMLSKYIVAIEQGKLIAPMIEWMYNEHKYASRAEIYGPAHLPDTICSGALGFMVSGSGRWSAGVSA